MKLKVESSGWPAEADTAEKRAAYLKWYSDIGIHVDPSDVIYNAAKRATAKFLLNAMV
jgi:hypothetical protein